MEFRIFKEGDNLCCSYFNDEVDLLVFLHDTSIEKLEVIISYNSNIYRVYCMLCDGFKISSIYDLLKFIKDLKDGY